VGYNCFGTRGNSDVALIQSNFGSPGHLEAVVREGDILFFYWRASSNFVWSGPSLIGTGAAGTPALFQSTHGNKGNFELVTPRAGGGLAHFWRNNDDPAMPWIGPAFFGEGNISGVAMIQGNFGNPGHLELVACNGGRLDFYFRDTSFQWKGPFVIGDGVRGTPGLIQSSHGQRGNFELAVPSVNGGFDFYWRDNDASGLPWRGPQRVGAGNYSHVSLVQSNFGPGNLEVLARQGNRWDLYWRDVNGFVWNGPFGVGIERSFRMSECIYSWTAAFHQQWTHITVRIQLNPATGISAATMNTLRTTWRNGIINEWSNRFRCQRPGFGAPTQPVTFDVLWVNGNAHHLVQVRTGPAQTDMTNWDTADTGNVAAHEFGHMIGWPDEYASATCPSRSPVNTGTVMDDNAGVVERLIEPFCAFLCGQDAIPV
jgi:hypothetical protein